MIDIKNGKTRTIALIINVIIVVMEILALILSLKKHSFYSFIYYTVLSNVLTLISCLCFIVYSFVRKNQTMPHWIQLLRYMGSNCLALTFLVVVTVLLPITENGFYRLFISGAQPYHHVLCPILSVISFGLLEDGKPTKKEALIASSPTLVYAIIASILNFARVLDGPYPFLKVYKQPFYMSIFWFVALLGISFGLALFIRYLTKFKKVEGENETTKTTTTEAIEMV